MVVALTLKTTVDGIFYFLVVAAVDTCVCILYVVILTKSKNEGTYKYLV